MYDIQSVLRLDLSPCHRDAEVLSLFAAIINKLREKIQGEVPRVFEAVFECTLTMITKNFEVCASLAPGLACILQRPQWRCTERSTSCRPSSDSSSEHSKPRAVAWVGEARPRLLGIQGRADRRLPWVQDYPEHRLQFFALLRAITNSCGGTLFAMSPQQLKLVIDSIVWAFRHTERNVADTGLNLLLEMLAIFDKSEVATQFYQTYFLHLTRELFAVMTGTLSHPLLPSPCSPTRLPGPRSAQWCGSPNGSQAARQGPARTRIPNPS